MRQPKEQISRLRRDETIWGYAFVAAPLLGFLIFVAGPLVASLVISFASWNLLTAPTWVGLQNWQEVFSLSFQRVPPLVDEATGERLYRCGASHVPASQVTEVEGTLDRRGRPVVCEPANQRVRDILPRRYSPAAEFQVADRSFVIGARDATMWQAMYNTFFLLLGVPIATAISLFLAILLNQKIRGAGLFSALFYLPGILPIAAVALIWLWIYNPDYGLLNYFLGLVGIPSVAWLQNPATVKPALIIMGVWGGLGFGVIIYLAGLQSISRELYEAAEIDGAGTWQKFTAITWPSLTPTTFFLFVTGLIGSLQVFVQPYIMTGGGPYNASRTMVMLIWENGFANLNMGYASAQAWLLGAIILLITIVNFVMARRWVFYHEAEA